MVDRPSFNIWEGVYRSFEEAPAHDSGFLSGRWIQQCLARAEAARVGVGGTPIPAGARAAEYPLTVAAATVARPPAPLRIVDFGGAAGDTYFALRAALPRDVVMAFDVIEHGALVAAARVQFADVSELRFLSDLSGLPDHADVVHAGSSLHYVAEWKSLLGTIVERCGPELLVLSDVPAGDIETFVTLQTYYQHKMPHWFWNLGEFVSEVERLGYRLAHQSRYVGIFLGERGPMPMANFDTRHRLDHACHLIFHRR